MKVDLSNEANVSDFLIEFAIYLRRVEKIFSLSLGDVSNRKTWGRLLNVKEDFKTYHRHFYKKWGWYQEGEFEIFSEMIEDKYNEIKNFIESQIPESSRQKLLLAEQLEEESVEEDFLEDEESMDLESEEPMEEDFLEDEEFMVIKPEKSMEEDFLKYIGLIGLEPKKLMGEDFLEYEKSMDLELEKPEEDTSTPDLQTLERFQLDFIIQLYLDCLILCSINYIVVWDRLCEIIGEMEISMLPLDETIKASTLRIDGIIESRRLPVNQRALPGGKREEITLPTNQTIEDRQLPIDEIANASSANPKKVSSKRGNNFLQKGTFFWSEDSAFDLVNKNANPTSASTMGGPA